MVLIFLHLLQTTKYLKKNNKYITLSIFYVPYEEEEIIDVLPEYICNHNFTRKKQIALLKISNGEDGIFQL